MTARATKIATKVLESDGIRTASLTTKPTTKKYSKNWTLQWLDLRALARSALTQATDKAKADRSGARLEGAYAAIRAHSDLCDSLFADIAILEERLRINDPQTLATNLLRAVNRARNAGGLGVYLPPSFMKMLRKVAKPKRKRTGPARIKSKRPSTRPPSAKSRRGSP